MPGLENVFGRDRFRSPSEWMRSMSDPENQVPRERVHVSEAEARRVAEAAREKKWDKATFVRDMFLGDRSHRSVSGPE